MGPGAPAGLHFATFRLAIGWTPAANQSLQLAEVSTTTSTSTWQGLSLVDQNDGARRRQSRSLLATAFMTSVINTECANFQLAEVAMTECTKQKCRSAVLTAHRELARILLGKTAKIKLTRTI